MPSTDLRRISIVLPAFNEAENLEAVTSDVAAVLEQIGNDFTILVVDDGSTDKTPEVLDDLSARHDFIHSVRLRRNFGKSAALAAAFERVDGDIVVLIDADGQDDPNELPELLAELDSGYDLVTGRRQIRSDRFIKRNTSKLYNWSTARVTGVQGKDFNSGFKVMRRPVVDSLDLYGELHRYIPVLAAWSGFRTTEVDVNHLPRLHGSSKFGRSRFWRGFLDLITVKFLTTYNARPFHLIGGMGILFGMVGAALLGWMLVEKLLGEAVGQRPALLTGVLLGMVGVQLITVGLLAELIVQQRPRQRQDPVVIETGPRSDAGSGPQP